MVLAARALAKDAQAVSLDVGGETHAGRALPQRCAPSDLQTAAADHQHRRGRRCRRWSSVTGAPMVPEPAAEKRLQDRAQLLHARRRSRPIRRKAKQNDRFAVVLKITEPQPQFGRIIVADYLPAGFEIDNPRLVSSGETGTLAWIEDAQEPVHSEFRDDRFIAAFDRKSDDRGDVHGRLCRARGVARPLRACRRPMSRTCTGPTASAAPPPARSR